MVAQNMRDLEVIVVFDGRPACDRFDDKRITVTSTGRAARGVAGALGL